MTHERHEEVVVAALVVSVLLHIGLMVAVRPQVMSSAAKVPRRVSRSVAMRVTKTSTRPTAVPLADLQDLKAVKDAPAVRRDQGVPSVTAPSEAVSAAKVPSVEAAKADAPVFQAKPKFETRPVGSASSAPAVPLLKIETPAIASTVSELPEFTVKMPEVKIAPMMSATPVSANILPSGTPAMGDEETVSAVFTPGTEVYRHVDERIVEAEKAAVKELLNAPNAEKFVKFANVVMTRTEAEDGTYFKVMVSPRGNLEVMPKDVVLVIDGSGSIGDDRFSSCRKAARRILRTATNSGDRFNLVVFRNAFSYCFRAWQDCTAESFAAGEKWLAHQTAHGRTDVFSTIRSVLTLPRDPKRPLVALVVTDGDANAGVSDTAAILSRFTTLNDGLVSVYMYGVKSSANRELLDTLTHLNRGESFVFEGWRWSAGEGMEELSERFRDPVLSDLRVIFAAGTQTETYPQLLRNLYRGGTLSFVGRVAKGTKSIAFSIRALTSESACEGFFKLSLDDAPMDASIVAEWESERTLARKFGVR